MFKKFYSLAFVSILLTNLSYAENTNPAKMIESCADQLFVAQFGDQLEDYLSISVKRRVRREE